MRNFAAADRLTKMMERFGLKEGESLEHPWLNKSVETAQKRVEQRNYMIRKRSLEYDDVMNKQREVIYGWRNEAIGTETPREMIYEVVDEAIPEKVISFLPPDDERNPQGLVVWANSTFPLGLTMEGSGFDKKDADAATNYLMEKLKHTYELKCSHEEPEALRYIERTIMLNAIDRLWQEHLYAMDGLRDAVHLRAYGQKDPLIEYKNEAYEMFTELMSSIKGEIPAQYVPVDEQSARFRAVPLAAPHAPARAATRWRSRRAATSAGGANCRGWRTRPEHPTFSAETRDAQGRPQRSLPLRQREEVQELLWTRSRVIEMIAWRESRMAA
jgi:preprotein translocase subunit SecA